MKITALIAAATLATVSTAALADSANVTTQSGEVVMVEKNMDVFTNATLAGGGGLAGILPFLFVGTVIAINAGGGS